MANNDSFPPLPISPAIQAMRQAAEDVRTGDPERAVLRRQVQRLERERDELQERVTELELANARLRGLVELLGYEVDGSDDAVSWFELGGEA